MRFFLLAILLISTPVIADEFSACVLPEPDRMPEKVSLPNVEGIISTVHLPNLIVNSTTGGPLDIETTANTSMFTVFGGFVHPDEVHTGQAIRIWFESCKLDSSGKAKAAVIQFHSTK